MADDILQPTLETVERPLNLIPVGLKEAALDSPTFRATALHFGDQIEVIERWLDGYVKAAARLVAEVNQLEGLVNTFLSHSMPPAQVSEAVLDHDYTMLAMQRYGEGAREFWQYTLRGVKRYDTAVVDPIKNFLNNELRAFKEARRTLEASQKSLDNVVARYAAQSKTKEPSSLREDAFQLHETRKACLRASMDFCISAPFLRATLDKLIVRIFAEQWKEMRTGREGNAGLFAKWSGEMERVRGWSKEMENSERAFKRELLTARRQIEESAGAMIRPSRELEDYAQSTVPYLGATTGAAGAKSGGERAEKQGWLFIRTVTGKPARTVWSRRWFFVKNGIFGWLIQGSRSGGVEESEKIGVLLCGVRPAFQEERRFCFEVKTKDTSIILQAETQQELTEWISAFEFAKRKALEDPASTETSQVGPGVDPSFAITPPIAPEFAAKVGDGHAQIGIDGEQSQSTPSSEQGAAGQASSDINQARRVTSLERQEGEGSRDHAARIMQRLDLHKRATATPSSSSTPGGIASLISASHNILPVGPGTPASATFDAPRRNITLPTSSLAPSTLANPPAATNLSHTAVVVSGERGIGLGKGPDGSGIPSGLMANLWGSNHWGYLNRLSDGPKQQQDESQSTSPTLRTTSITHSQDDVHIMDGMSETHKELPPLSADDSGLRHRKTLSVVDGPPMIEGKPKQDDTDEYPNYYPLPLKAQHAQFRMLFPSVPRAEKVVLVFRATWNPNEQQEFPGRVYVTPKDIYLYSNHLGLVLTTGVSLSSVKEVTAAPGRDCDFLYVHLKERKQEDDPRRITVKVFLEPMRLLQRRLNFLVHNAHASDPVKLEEVLKTLIKMEVEEPQRSSSVESWEEVTYGPDSPTRAGDQQRSPRRERNVKASLRIDGALYADPARTGREVQKFKLPAQPVVYAPQGIQAGITRDFNVSAKALFHVIFGDKSAVFQLLYCKRWADRITQTAWTKTPAASQPHWTRRFTSQDHLTPLADTQTIDIFNDHLCYVVTHTTTPWRMPYSSHFLPTTKIVITHTSKSRCKLAVFQHIAWQAPPRWSYVRRVVEKQALNGLEADALDLSTVAMDQVAKLGSHSKTNRAIEIFGNVGQQTSVTQIDAFGINQAQRVKLRQPVSLVRLIADDIVIKVLRTMGMVLDVFMALGKTVLGICTAHTLLVALLAFSALYNGWHGYRDGMTWWHERSASRFMARIGVRPDPSIGKAVYLREIEQLIATPSMENDTTAAWAPSSDASKTCRSTFVEHLTTSPSLPSSKHTGVRLHRTREAMARYRHDLLVALRVVNRVERDIVSAEWEDWLRVEERRCARVEDMIRQRSGGNGSKRVQVSELDAELGVEFAEYCASCRNDLDGMVM